MPDESLTIGKKAGCGTVYLTISEGDNKLISLKGGKAGTCLHSQLTALGFALTLAMRKGATIAEMAETLEHVPCPQSLVATGGPTSCGDAVSRLLKSYIKESK